MIRLGLNLSIAALKNGWFDNGWFVTLPGFEIVWKLVAWGAVVADLMFDLFVVYGYFILRPPFANFLINGLLCCCYSVNTGFWATTLAWVATSWLKMAKN